MDKNGKMVGHIDQPVYYVQPFQGDEIDLVDLWIIATNYKKIFLVSAFVLVTFSLIAVTIKFTPAYPFKSILELRSVPGEIGFAKSSASLIARTELSILPRMKAQTTDESLLEKIDSVKLSNPTGTGLILVDNLVLSGQEKAYADFHQKLLDEIIAGEVQRLLPVRQKMQTESLLIVQRINNIKADLSVLDREFEVRTASINAQFEEPDQSLKDLEKKIRVEKSPLQIDMELLSSQLSEIELQKKMLLPSIVLQSVMSDEPKGLSIVVVFVLAIFMSLFLALFVTMGVIFSQKVKQRRAGEG